MKQIRRTFPLSDTLVAHSSQKTLIRPVYLFCVSFLTFNVFSVPNPYGTGASLKYNIKYWAQTNKAEDDSAKMLNVAKFGDYSLHQTKLSGETYPDAMDCSTPLEADLLTAEGMGNLAIS